MKKVVASLTASVAALALLAPSASAATEFGNGCVADGGGGGISVVGLANAPGNPLSPSVPVAGVITNWKLSTMIPPGSGFSQTLKVFRPTGVPKQVQVIAQTPPEVVSNSIQSFSARIPVQAGDLIGGVTQPPTGEAGTFLCETLNPADRVGFVPIGSTVGSVVPLEEEAGLALPITATVEPDSDNDGFGDNTQDLCPQSAAIQTACPVVVLDAFAISGGNAIKVLVATSTTVPVKVAGTVKLGKGSNAKLGAKQKTVAAGKITAFKLAFPGSLKEKLKEIGPSQKLTAKITASATNVGGQVSTDKLKAKLKGQG